MEKPRPLRPVRPLPLGAGGVALVLLITALWGGNPVAVSYSVDTLPPIAVAGIRFALGAAVMVAWCRLEGSPLLPRGGQWSKAVIAGLLLFAQIGLFNIGVQLSNASHSSLLINTFVFWVVAIEHLVTGTDRLSPLRGSGLLIAACGAALMFLTPAADAAAVPVESAGGWFDRVVQSPALQGDLVMLASAAVLGIKIVYTKHALKTVQTGTLILWHDIVGVVLFAAVSWSFETITWNGFGPAAIAGLLYQGLIVAGLCFGLQAILLRRHSATRISVFAFLTPVFGIAAGVLLRGDPLSPWLIAATVCIAAGIVLVNLPGQRSPRKPD